MAKAYFSVFKQEWNGVKGLSQAILSKAEAYCDNGQAERAYLIAVERTQKIMEYLDSVEYYTDTNGKQPALDDPALYALFINNEWQHKKQNIQYLQKVEAGKMGGAPKGNQNAKGHGAPKGNKNAAKAVNTTVDINAIADGNNDLLPF